MADRSVAWIFPGQGSQKVGAGQEAAQAFPAAAQVFHIADATLDIPVSDLCWNGPEEELTRTANQQPAIVTISIALFKALESAHELPKPAYVAGHSLGEYSALVAAGALDFTDALRLVRRRGQLMEQHGLGGMLAILGLDIDAVQLLAGETGVEVANNNCPGQVVVSGTEEALAVAEMAAKERGAKRAVRLAVNGAFHSLHMRPVAAELAHDIEATAFHEPIAPLVTNVNAQPISHPDDLRQELVDQIANSVQWVDVMQVMINEGVENYLEIGPGNVLAGLARRIDRAITVQPAEQMLKELVLEGEA